MNTSSRIARLWRDGQWLHVVPALEEVLRPVLQTWARCCRPSPEGVLQAGRRSEPLYEGDTFAGKPILRCWCGLTPVVHATLHLAGYDIQFGRDLYHGNLSLPTEERIVASLWDMPVVEHVARNDRGLILYDPDHVRPGRLVAQIAEAWPNRNITLTVSTREKAYSAVRELRAGGVDAFAFTARNQPTVKTRVAVTTYAGMAYNTTGPWDQNIVLCLDAAAAVGKHSLWCMPYLERARLYGLLPVQRQLSPYEQDLVHCVFGFEQVVVLRHGHAIRSVEVLWTLGEGRRLDDEPTNPLELKRNGIWHNEARNRQVARIARAFAAGDQDQLKKLLPSLPGSRMPAGPSRVIVQVENVEHALRILPKLPGWPIVASGLINLDGLPTERRAELERRLAAGRTVSPGYCIVTEVGLTSIHLPLKDMNVVVRADGGTGMLSLPSNAMMFPTYEQVAGPMLVVDVDDRHHPQLRRHARQRRTMYTKAGWPAAGKNPVCLRLGEFLRYRLQGGRR